MASFDEMDGFPVVPGMESDVMPSKGPIELNVGGVVYCASFSTLTKYPNSYFSSRLSGRFGKDLEIDSNNRLFIDRDGVTFRHILNYLRTGKVFLPETIDQIHQYRALVEEAEFYSLLDLAEMTREAMTTLDIGSEQSLVKKGRISPLLTAPSEPLIPVAPTISKGLQRFASPRVESPAAKLSENIQPISLDFESADQLDFEGETLDF